MKPNLLLLKFLVVLLLCTEADRCFCFSEVTEAHPGSPNSEAAPMGTSSTLSRPVGKPNAHATVEEIPPVFDYSTSFAPRSSSDKSIKRNTTPMSVEDDMERNESISVTKDGKVDTLKLPEEIRQRIIETIRKIKDERKSDSRNSENLSVFSHTAAMSGPEQSTAGPPESKSFVFSNTRDRITGTDQYPFRAIGYVGFESQWCSGTLVGVRHVLTAGHCIYNTATDRWYHNIMFYPGRNGRNLPYGSVSWSRLLSVVGWTRDHDDDSDFGLIVLDQDIGNETGWLAFGYEEPMQKYTVNLVGYPGDEPSGTMWQSVCPLEEITESTLSYRCDTAPGSSGAAVYAYWPNNKNREVFGVNAYEFTDGSAPNFGPRINKVRFETLNQWIHQY